MSECPHPDIWQRWLRRWLVPAPREEASLISHLESCSDCRQCFLNEYDGLRANASVDLSHVNGDVLARLRQLHSGTKAGTSQRDVADPRPAQDNSPASEPAANHSASGVRAANPRENPLDPVPGRSPVAQAATPGNGHAHRNYAATQNPIVVSYFQIRRKIGEGAMGVVLEAEDTRNHKRIALKLMKPELARLETNRQRFLREARIAAGLQHPNIVTIYEVGEFSGTPYIAMEYLVGESLRERLKRHGPLPWREVCRIGAQVAEGLAAAHQRNLIHRDVKPANIWLQHPYQRVKLLDFSLARFQDQDVELTKSGVVVGTPAYMSPEQIRGWELDERADLFSLGVVLYECLVGRRPFSGDDIYAVITQVLTEHPPSPSQLRPGIPETISDYVMKLLEKDRERRPRTATDVADTLRQLAEGKFAESASAPARSASAAGSLSPRPPTHTVPPLGGMPWVYWPTPSSQDSDRSSDEDVTVRSGPIRKRKKRRNPPFDYWRWLVVSAAIVLPMLVVYFIGTSFWRWYYEARGPVVLEIEEAALGLWGEAEVRISDAGGHRVAVLRGLERQVSLSPRPYTVQCTGAPELELNRSEFTVQARRVTPLIVRRRSQQPPPGAGTQTEPTPPGPNPESEPQRLGRELLQQIAQAPPDSVISLPAGEYLLPGQLLLSKPITIIGAGPEQTVIRGAAAPALIACQAPGTVRLSNVTLEYVGMEPANVIIASSGSLDMENCVCRGAKKVSSQPKPSNPGPAPSSTPATAPFDDAERQPSFGNGLAIINPISATIRNCTFTQNQANGIMVFSAGVPANSPSITVQSSRFENNEEAGICFQGWARGTAWANYCANNHYGILVTHRAFAQLQSNRCERNRTHGIAFCQQSNGFATNNTCINNSLGDFLVERSSGAHPVFGVGNVGVIRFR
ncbi:Serine/threonine-protein kinase PknB [bacterium HR36]|nr:Serine/threonine-protein kinase PknB [bacterium HR36]